MIGSTVSARMMRLPGMPVRRISSAQASPSRVVMTPQSTARISVFQATPQLVLLVTQPSPQIEESKKASTKAAGAKAPFWSTSALFRMIATGKKMKMPISRMIRPIVETVKRSPRQTPR